MRFSESEVARRKPLWCALAEVWLDTDVPEYRAVSIVKAMRAGDFSLAEAQTIFLSEVSPAFCFNGFSVIGEWAGWDADFVLQQVLGYVDASWLRQRTLLLASLALRSSLWRHNLPSIQRALDIDSNELMAMTKLAAV